jgi:hypothetical protein
MIHVISDDRKIPNAYFGIALVQLSPSDVKESPLPSLREFQVAEDNYNLGCKKGMVYCVCVPFGY